MSNHKNGFTYSSPILKLSELYIGLLIVLVVSIFVFYCAFLFTVWQDSNLHLVSDLTNHAQTVLDSARTHHFPVYSLWYKLIYIISGFSTQYDTIAYTSIVMLALLIAIKYIISYWILSENCIANERLSVLVCLALIFCMPLPSYYNYSYHVVVGNVVPNQWHNSTSILVMPINLLLFYYSVKNVKSDQLYSFLIMGLLSLIGIMCKPNYALAYLPVISMFILIVNIRASQYVRALIKCSLLAVPSVLMLGYQQYFTFIDSSILLHNSTTIIAPFLVWSQFSPHIFISILLSIAFPLLILTFYFKKINFGLALAWLIFLTALATFSLLAESPNWVNGNYGWGLISSNYILFLFSAICLLNQPNDWKFKISFVVFCMHFLSGCFLLGSFFIRQTSLLL